MLFPDRYPFRAEQSVLSTQIDPKDTTRLLRQAAVASDLDRVLRTFRHRHCQDPRDRIFGLLGFTVHHHLASIQPNYELDTKQVLMKAADTIIGCSNSDLRYMTGSGYNSDNLGIPSWVRDFAASLDGDTAGYEMRRYEPYNLYNACCTTKADVRRTSGSTLSLTGVFIDTVDQVGQQTVGARLWSKAYWAGTCQQHINTHRITPR